MKSYLVAVLTGLTLLCHASDGVADEHDHEIALGFTPLSWSWHIGHHNALSDEKLDVSSAGAVGGSVSYARRWRYFRIGPTFEYIHPFFGGGKPGAMNELRFMLAAAGVVPLLDDDLDLSFGVEGGLATFVFDPNPAVGTEAASDAALGWTVGALLGVTGWVSELIGLRLEFGGGISRAGSSEDSFDVSQIRLLKVNGGVVFGL